MADLYWNPQKPEIEKDHYWPNCTLWKNDNITNWTLAMKLLKPPWRKCMCTAGKVEGTVVTKREITDSTRIKLDFSCIQRIILIYWKRYLWKVHGIYSAESSKCEFNMDTLGLISKDWGSKTGELNHWSCGELEDVPHRVLVVCGQYANVRDVLGKASPELNLNVLWLDTNYSFGSGSARVTKAGKLSWCNEKTIIYVFDWVWHNSC